MGFTSSALPWWSAGCRLARDAFEQLDLAQAAAGGGGGAHAHGVVQQPPPRPVLLAQLLGGQVQVARRPGRSGACRRHRPSRVGSGTAGTGGAAPPAAGALLVATRRSSSSSRSGVPGGRQATSARVWG